MCIYAQETRVNTALDIVSRLSYLFLSASFQPLSAPINPNSYKVRTQVQKNKPNPSTGALISVPGGLYGKTPLQLAALNSRLHAGLEAPSYARREIRALGCRGLGSRVINRKSVGLATTTSFIVGL